MSEEELLYALALGSREPRDLSAVDQARAIIRARGLAFGYAALDHAAAVALALRADDEPVSRSPLASLLAEEAARIPPRSMSAGAVVSASSVFACVLLFFVVSQEGPPGTKGGSSLPEHPIATVLVKEARGPLAPDAVVRGLEPRANALAACAPKRSEVDVQFIVAGDGLVRSVTARAGDVGACVADVIRGTAFELQERETDVRVHIQLHP